MPRFPPGGSRGCSWVSSAVDAVTEGHAPSKRLLSSLLNFFSIYHFQVFSESTRARYQRKKEL